MPGILFPHAIIPESTAGKIIDFFGHIKVFQPWYMESPDFMKDESIEINYPPESLKPGKDFLSLVAEYRLWAVQNRDKSYMEITKWNRDKGMTDNRTWEIRRLLNQTVRSVSGTDKENNLHDHLLLHFAGEIEKQHAEVDRILKNLKKKDSLLKGSIEKVEEKQNLLEDLPLFEQEPVFHEKNLKQIFSAWIGLFGEYLKGNEPLVTLNRLVLDSISEKWDRLDPEGKTGFKSMIGFTVPYLSQGPEEKKANIQREYREDIKLEEIKDLIFRLHEDPPRNLALLDRLCKDFNPSYPGILSEQSFKITLRYLYPYSENECNPGDNVMDRLSNKAIILIEE